LIELINKILKSKLNKTQIIKQKYKKAKTGLWSNKTVNSNAGLRVAPLQAQIGGV
jgi:hypothetical protein